MSNKKKKRDTHIFGLNDAEYESLKAAAKQAIAIFAAIGITLIIVAITSSIIGIG